MSVLRVSFHSPFLISLFGDFGFEFFLDFFLFFHIHSFWLLILQAHVFEQFFSLFLLLLLFTYFLTLFLLGLLLLLDTLEVVVVALLDGLVVLS